MVTALILSGGTGTRLGADIPKQYIEVCGRPIISYCMECLFAHEQIDAVQIVADEMWRPMILTCMKDIQGRKSSRGSMRSVRDTANSTNRTNVRESAGGSNKLRGFSLPGENRQLSILHGLEDILRRSGEAADKDSADVADLVLIHDAARPLLSARQITDCLEAVKGHDGVVPVLPMKDTVYLSEDGMTLTSLLERSQIYAGQAPELFALKRYYDANTRLLPEEILKINGSTEPAVMAGMDIAMIPGDERNFKVTTREDLTRLEEIVRQSGY